ncbi:mandelate racemase/muconate lactonizing enzyme family protein [Compostimonas suwonensis]|uniref:D-galactarolactone cycloisomerase n=1 Tax=Compostimonas suwonensis TaxID=1048394 RepID=A0A2M9C3L5_9MICO|nr:enolase C-terminal domain-like protein [Compostimonas suwonensis]PJJ65102.1 D-galactarolactone cycloisomerase [Compostimonas suwonensis]
MAVIESIDVVGLEYEAGPLNRDRWGDREQACMLAITAGGQTGYAMSRCNLGLDWRSIGTWLLGHIGPQLVGLDTDDHAAFYARMLRDYSTQFLPVFPLSVADVALWDLRGLLEGRSVARMLAEEPAATVRAYASIPRFSDVEAGVAAAVEQDAAGFRGIKVHFSGDLERDLVLSRRIREELPHTELSFDAANELSYDDALHVGRVYVELGGEWLEEPFAAYDFDTNARLRRDLPGLAIVGFETAPGGPRAAELAIRSGAFDYIEIDCLWKGGISGAFQVAQAAAAHGQRVAIHHGGSPSMNLANIQLVAAAGNVDTIGLTTPVLDYNRAAAIPPLDPESGTILVPDGPGLGQQIDGDFVRMHEIARTRITR